ncbi:hypothetical protein M406DRAFT_52836 [Cryphonectria parasitica EP155]|uniref:Choline transporter n=1 Tax=Cryphonectria parasitica (strain ATCC 38755 / EP155) TaxID=660469 RepID=A0A9P4XTA5_CRYP1|nr:uncharacterized protein M406DRAFT_52836 [Cryphonectria parasitica EP155]KAF3760375.1 hypothetical protein M406DRAFT_52836 [Cryphonectria parasitica EP155]
MESNEDKKRRNSGDLTSVVDDAELGTVSNKHEAPINASGHVQEMPRQFNLISLAGVGVTVGNVWPAIGGTILVAISNGGPPGVLYEFLVVSCFYFLVAASLAELVSAIPSSAGVYHWASVTPGPRWGRMVGFFAGWWNYLGWCMGAASMAAILGNTIVQMYALNHDGFIAQPWHVFVVYVICVWIGCAAVCLANSAMPPNQNLFLIYSVLAGFFITVVAVAAMPGHNGRPPHATSDFVWKEWAQALGYSDGFVFVAGMLNGAYSIGSVDVITHLAEEIPNPQRNVPIGMALQLGIGFSTGFCYLVAIMYAINDLSAVSAATYPIAEIYRQATGTAGATAMLALIMVNIALCVIGLFITTGRTLWALARDGAVPFPNLLGKVNRRLDMPMISTITTAVLVTVLGCIYVGSTTAFNAFIASTILFFSSSYIACILPHLLRGRKGITYGPFRMHGWVGYVVNGLSCAYLMIWFVIYSFPYYLPTDAASMNYSCLIWGGLTVLVGLWWLLGARKGYEGPKTTGGVVVAEL